MKYTNDRRWGALRAAAGRNRRRQGPEEGGASFKGEEDSGRRVTVTLKMGDEAEPIV